MEKIFKIESNEQLLKEAIEILSEEIPSDLLDKHNLMLKIREIQNKIFNYKEETFKNVDEYLKHNSSLKVQIILNQDLENVIEKLFVKSQSIFK